MTRPRELAGRLAERIEAAGGRVWLFPAIEIHPPADPAAAKRRLERLHAYDLAVFISPTAVSRALENAPAWPPGLRAFAVGAGTRAELARRGIEARGPEERADSEALLALPELQAVHGRTVLIVRGEGGRALLADTLRSRGARVECAECYRRALPAADPGPLLSAWERGHVHAVTASSAEGVANLFALLGARGGEALRATPLFVPHARIAEAARGLGVRSVFVAGTTDDEMLARLVAYFDAP